MQPADGPERAPLDLARVAPLLIVGAVTLDVVHDARVPGGAVSYAARVAAAFGITSYILTTASEDADLEPLEGHRVHVVPSSGTLVYEHQYDTGARRLRLRSRPDRPLRASDVPSDWPRPRTILLGPLAPGDLDVGSFLEAYPDVEVGLLAQGLQRRIDAEGYAVDLDAPSDALIEAARANVSVFLSADETQAWPAGALDVLAGRARRVVRTLGAEGAAVRTGGRIKRVPAPRATVVDTTGAGDVFAAAFILAVGAGADDQRAGRLAAAYAAANVARRGPAALPALAALEAQAASAPAARAASERDARGGRP